MESVGGGGMRRPVRDPVRLTLLLSALQESALYLPPTYWLVFKCSLICFHLIRELH